MLAVVFAALVAAASASSYASNSSLDAVASWLAMRPVTIRCLTPEETEADPVIAWGAAAYVEGLVDESGWHPFDYTVFMYGLCEPLAAVQAGDVSAYTVQDVAWAVLVLTHESGHLRGHAWSASEALTECWAIRHVGYVAYRLGITDSPARRMVVHEAVRFHKAMGPDYRLKGCRLPRA